MSSATAWAILGAGGILLVNVSLVGLMVRVGRQRDRHERRREEARDVRA